MDQMTKLEKLNQCMDRIKQIMDVTGMSMEELIAESAVYHIDCGKCPIKSICKQYLCNNQIACTDLWTMYLKGVIDG